jgi:hypothetical protein
MLRSRWPKAVVTVEADETWKETKTPFLVDMLAAVNPIERGEDRQQGDEENEKTRTDEIEIPYRVIDQKYKLLKALNRRKLLIIIDEGHHIGIQNYNFVKTLINRTNCVFAIFAHPVLFKQFELKSFLETSQLTQNRLFERYNLIGPTGPEVHTFLNRRKVQFTDDKLVRQCADKLAQESKDKGAWKFIKLVTRRLRKASAKTPIDLEQFIESLTAVLKTR